VPDIFELHQVSFGYDRVIALDRVDLTIGAGEKVAILGANGSGKSTLLKLLDGLYFPSAGQVTAFGLPLTSELLEDEAYAFAFRRRVALVFQDPDVQLFSPTVWDEVAFGPLQLGLAKEEIVERVQTTLRLLNIEKLRDRSPHRLSGGEKKKVALASVLAVQPEVLLLDEPTAALDPRSKSNLVDFLIQMHKSGKTIVTATHDLDIVCHIADRVYVLGEDNRLVAAGHPAEILADVPLLERTNLIHVHVHGHGYGEEQLHAHPHLHSDFHEHEH